MKNITSVLLVYLLLSAPSNSQGQSITESEHPSLSVAAYPGFAISNDVRKDRYIEELSSIIEMQHQIIKLQEEKIRILTALINVKEKAQ
jgi:hypothetical protein